MPLNKERVVAWPDSLPFDRQSIPVPGTKRPGQTAHYRNAIWGLIDEKTPNTFTTLDQVFEDGLKTGRERGFLGYRPVLSTHPFKLADRYEWVTWGEADDKRRYIGSALHSLFSKGEVGGGEYDTVGIWSANRPEWQILDIAMQTHRKVSVSLYDTLGKDSVEYIINHAHTTVVFATSEHVPTLLKLAPKVPCLKLVVIIDSIPAQSAKVFVEWGQSVGIRVQGWHEVEAYGKANLIEPIKPTPETVASICYTSGTTDKPKGVILTHKSLAMSVSSNLHGLTLLDDGILMSYLPLAHIYERLCELSAVAVGARIGYFSGDPLRLLEDAQLLKPNLFPSVPRVLNRVYQAAMAGGNVPGLKGKIFKKALETKLERLHATGEVTHPFWDRIVFRKIQRVLGGQLQLVTSGSAPISAEIMDFVKIAFACEVSEGYDVTLLYGMTELMATSTRSWPGDRSASGTVGPPAPINEVKLVDVPSLGYTSEDKPNPRGELCVRGANVFVEYYKDVKVTKETIDEEGWLHTGDVAEIDTVGRVKIIDRVKNIMKLAQGEYVALEKIENLFSAYPSLAQIYVHGDSLQSYLVAIVIPDSASLAPIVSQILGKHITPEDQAGLEEAIKDARVNAHFLSGLTAYGQKLDLRGFEMIKRIHLSLVPFSIENGTLTPTMKIKRREASKLYRSEITGLYGLGEPSSSRTSVAAL